MAAIPHHYPYQLTSSRLSSSLEPGCCFCFALTTTDLGLVCLDKGPTTAPRDKAKGCRCLTELPDATDAQL